MGLSIEVGLLASLFREDPEGAEWLTVEFMKINRLLARNGLPLYEEPRDLPELDNRSQIDGFPYSFIHYLRRVAAHQIADPAFVAEPLPEEEDPTDDPVLEEEYTMLRSHLICHSDADGYYIPVDFEDPLFDDREEIAGGGILCSSIALLTELIDLAPALGIALDDGELSDEEAARLNRETEEEEGLWIEKLVWLTLYEAARLSVKHRTAIIFS